MHEIRRMKIEDLSQVVSLEAACFSHPWSEKNFRDALLSDDALYLAAEEDGRILGYCGFYISYETADLCNVLVSGEMRRSGLGTELLDAAFQLLKERQVERILLEVREGNVPARRLYEKLGFQEIGVRKRYYSEPSEDAVLMELGVLHFTR